MSGDAMSESATSGGNNVLDRPLSVINLGLEIFASDLETVGVPVIHVDWQPPAGDARTAALLARLADDDE